METAGRRLPQSGAIDLNRLGGSVNRPYPRKNGCSLRAQDRGNTAAGGSGYNCFVIPSEAEEWSGLGSRDIGGKVEGQVSGRRTSQSLAIPLKKIS